ncbi:MAG: hypothetical protein HGA85_03380 [Nanoarchaeota archaeon]|nr:hypothetical protein [Nanoarchaeota archaeon]
MVKQVGKIKPKPVTLSSLAAEGEAFKRWENSPQGRSAIQRLRDEEADKTQFEKWESRIKYDLIGFPKYSLCDWDLIGLFTPQYFLMGQNQPAMQVEGFLEKLVNEKVLIVKKEENDCFHHQGYDFTNVDATASIYMQGKKVVAVVYDRQSKGQYATSHGFTSSSIDIYERENKDHDIFLRPSFVAERGLEVYKGKFGIPLQKLKPENLFD